LLAVYQSRLRAFARPLQVCPCGALEVLVSAWEGALFITD